MNYKLPPRGEKQKLCTEGRTSNNNAMDGNNNDAYIYIYIPVPITLNL